MPYDIPAPPFPWTCPFCNHDSTIIKENFQCNDIFYGKGGKYTEKVVVVYFILCPNPKCKKFTLTISLHHARREEMRIIPSAMIKQWKLIPPSEAKVFPDYVPQPILNDYLEACLIRDLSPKASATLARRCLQGMIRDFWKVKKSNLKQEIEAIEDRIDPLTWKAIDAVRKVGNIGAHMEQDINLIIEVDPDEAKQLINLIEILVKDWYVTRHEREERLKSIGELGNLKKSQKKKKEEPLKKEI